MTDRTFRAGRSTPELVAQNPANCREPAEGFFGDMASRSSASCGADWDCHRTPGYGGITEIAHHEPGIVEMSGVAQSRGTNVELARQIPARTMRRSAPDCGYSYLSPGLVGAPKQSGGTVGRERIGLMRCESRRTPRVRRYSAPISDSVSVGWDGATRQFHLQSFPGRKEFASAKKRKCEETAPRAEA